MFGHPSDVWALKGQEAVHVAALVERITQWGTSQSWGPERNNPVLVFQEHAANETHT